MDALSDVLRAVRLTGAVFFNVDAAAPWVVETPAGSTIVGKIFPSADHLIPYHVITRGTCWAGVAGASPERCSAGDIVMFPQGDHHVLASAPGMRDRPNMNLYRRPRDRSLPFGLSMGDNGDASVHLVCGYLGCDARPFNPLLAALPRMLRTSADGPLASYMQFALAEAGGSRIGAESVLGRLSELMFLDVVRRYLETLPSERTDWLAGLRDPFVGRALTALHRDPGRAWTLASLSRAAGLSRSAFAERFTEFVGRPPMQYLASWRMQLAASDLARGDSVAAVASRVGYDSEAAFSRAFKKAVGLPPGAWRQRRAGERAG